MWSKIETKMLRRYSNGTSEHVPVFIVGLPRSGTTLFYQLLLNHFDWSYFTRWTNHYYRSPVTAYRMQHILFPKPRNFAYKSNYGKTQDSGYLVKPWRPVEGHRIWHSWFPEEPTHCYRDTLSMAAREEILATIVGFSTISGKPFLNKNTRNSMRITALSEVFPKALFIVVRRESLYIAQSLYIARLYRKLPVKTRMRRKFSRKDFTNKWWGTKPREYVYLKDLDPLRQSVGQTRAIELELTTQLRTCMNHYMEVDYKDICERPAHILHQVKAFCLENGVKLWMTGGMDPTPFPLENKRKVSEEEFDTIKNLLESI